MVNYNKVFVPEALIINPGLAFYQKNEGNTIRLF